MNFKLIGLLGDRFHVCDECLHVNKERKNVRHKCLNVLYECFHVNKKRENVCHKCFNVLYGWNDVFDEGDCASV